MRKGYFIHRLLVAALAVPLVSLVSCERHLDISGEASSVQISIDLPGNMGVEEGPWTKADGDYVNASQYEGVRTLRIIVTSGPAEDRTILYNQKVEGLTNVDTYTTTIPDLPHDSLTFFAIANEESLDMTYDDETIKSNLAENHKLLFLDDVDPKHFPARGPDIVGHGIPMSGSTAVRLTGDMSVRIDLYRSVVKLALVVENATKSPVTLREVSFGEFFGDCYYMFRDVNLDVPDEIQYTDMVYENLNIVIPGANDEDPSVRPYTDTLSAYFYPTHPAFEGGNSPFTLGLTTGSGAYPSQVFAPNRTFFIRNTQVNLRVRITTDVGIEIDFEVAPWDEYEVEVPTFD